MVVGFITASYLGYVMAAGLVLHPVEDPLSVLEKRQWPVGYGVQMFRSSIIVSDRQIVAAFLSASDAFRSGRGRTRRIEMEFLLRLAARRQIDEAISLAGIGEGEERVGVAVISQELDPVEGLMLVARLLGGRVSGEIAYADPRDAARLYGVEPGAVSAVPRSEGADPLELLILERIAASGIME